MIVLEESAVKALYVTNLDLNENEGIYKKICAQAGAIGTLVGQCKLLMADHATTKIVDVTSGEITHSVRPVLEVAKCEVESTTIDVLYIRLMVSTPSLIQLMRTAHSRNTRVFYEIPTYPYYGEQLRASRKKYRAVGKIAIDFFFSPLIKRYVDHIVIIKSNDKVHLHPKMIEISNGIKADDIVAKRKYNTAYHPFRLVAVGTLYPYHGYDRILQGLKNCNEEVEGCPVEFHVIGKSNTINDLRQTAEKMRLKRVFFHGVKTTNELNQMYEDFDVGLGCLALHRRNANIDTTLKIVEYYCRGVPVVTSGNSPYRDPYATIRVPDQEGPIDIQEIYNQWKKIPQETLSQLSSRAKQQFNWNTIMKKLFVQTGLVKK